MRGNGFLLSASIRVNPRFFPPGNLRFSSNLSGTPCPPLPVSRRRCAEPGDWPLLHIKCPGRDMVSVNGSGTLRLPSLGIARARLPSGDSIRIESDPCRGCCPSRHCFASRLRVRILPRGSGREEPDQAIDPFARVTGVMRELVKIFVIHPRRCSPPVSASQKRRFRAMSPNAFHHETWHQYFSVHLPVHHRER